MRRQILRAEPSNDDREKSQFFINLDNWHGGRTAEQKKFSVFFLAAEYSVSHDENVRSCEEKRDSSLNSHVTS